MNAGSILSLTKRLTAVQMASHWQSFAAMCLAPRLERYRVRRRRTSILNRLRVPHSIWSRRGVSLAALDCPPMFAGHRAADRRRNAARGTGRLPGTYDTARRASHIGTYFPSEEPVATSCCSLQPRSHFLPSR